MDAEGAGVPAVGSEVPEDLYRRLVESVSVVTYALPHGEGDQPFTYVSPQSEAVLGLTHEEMMVSAADRIRRIHPDDRGRVLHDIARLETTGGWDAEYRIVLPDGSTRWIHDRSRLAPEVDGRPAMWFGVLTPLRHRDESERALVDAETRYQALIEQLPAVVYIDTYEARPVTLYVSRQIEGVSGYRPEEWIADPDLWLRVVHPDDRHDLEMRPDWPAQLGDAEIVAIEYRIVHRDGHIVWVKDVARLVRSPDGTPLFWQGLIHDISDVKRTEQLMSDSERRYRTLVEQVPAVVFIDSHEESPVCYYVSPQSMEMLGYQPEEFQNDPTLFFSIIHPDDLDRVAAAWTEAVRYGDSFFCDFRLFRRDGVMLFVREAAVLMRDDDGAPAFWQGLIQDLSDRKRAEDSVRASEARYRMLVEQVPAVVYEMDPDDERRTLFVSPQVEALFGYSREEWLDQPDIWTELLHPDDREIELAAHDLHNETGEPWIQEYRLIASDGRVVWVRDQARLVRDESGNASTWQGIMLDITPQKYLEERLRQSNDELELRVLQRRSELEEANEMMSLEIGERKRIEVELRETQERYRRLVEDLPAVVYMWQVRIVDGSSLVYTSPRIEQLLGYSAEEWNVPDAWKDRLHPHDRERVLAATARSETTGEPFSEEYRVFAKDGRLVTVFDHATLLSRDDRGHPHMFQGVLMDVTDQHRARGFAVQSAERYRELAEDGPVVFSVLEIEPGDEPKYRLRYISPQIQDILGYPAARFYANVWNWLDIVHPDDREIAEEIGHRSIDGHPWDVDYRMIADHGRIVWMHLEGRTAARDDHGRPVRLQGIMMDFSSRKEREVRVDREATQLRSLVESMPGVPWIYAVDDPADWRPIYIAPQVQQLIGYTAAELMAEPRFFQRLVHPDDLAGVLALAARSIGRGEPWMAEFRVATRDGRLLWLRSRGSPGQDDHGRPVLHGVWIDISAERDRTGAPVREPHGQRER